MDRTKVTGFAEAREILQRMFESCNDILHKEAFLFPHRRLDIQSPK